MGYFCANTSQPDRDHRPSSRPLMSELRSLTEIAPWFWNQNRAAPLHHRTRKCHADHDFPPARMTLICDNKIFNKATTAASSNNKRKEKRSCKDDHCFETEVAKLHFFAPRWLFPSRKSSTEMKTMEEKSCIWNFHLWSLHFTRKRLRSPTYSSHHSFAKKAPIQKCTTPEQLLAEKMSPLCGFNDPPTSTFSILFNRSDSLHKFCGAVNQIFNWLKPWVFLNMQATNCMSSWK